MSHVLPAHHETSKRDSPHEARIKVKLLKCPGFEFKPRHVNDSSQSNQGTDHLVSHKVTLHLPAGARLQASVHTTIAKSLGEIPIVWEYLDVFLDELSNIPLDRVVELKIELQPGMAPILKQPYQMPQNELVELKIQLQELLDKGYIQPSPFPWGCSALFVKKKDHSLHLCVDY
jgi:hypothetical protein